MGLFISYINAKSDEKPSVSDAFQIKSASVSNMHLVITKHIWHLSGKISTSSNTDVDVQYTLTLSSAKVHAFGPFLERSIHPFFLHLCCFILSGRLMWDRGL